MVLDDSWLLHAFFCNIFKSSDGGLHWVETSSPSGLWEAITSSNSGQYLAAVLKNGYVYYSDDYGDNWMQANAPATSWQSIAYDGPGEYLAVAAEFGIYTSTCIFSPTSQPASKPSSSPSHVTSQYDQTATIIATGPLSSYTFTNIGYSVYDHSAVYLTVQLLVSEFEVASGAFINVTVGSVENSDRGGYFSVTELRSCDCMFEHFLLVLHRQHRRVRCDNIFAGRVSSDNCTAEHSTCHRQRHRHL